MIDDIKVSVIIPVYNEGSKILQCIYNVEKIAEIAEVIFVDGHSSDNTVSFIPKKYTVLSCEKGRAKQMNYGAQNASGNVLFFLHCDSVLPDFAIEEINQVMKTHKVGCFGILFDSKSKLMRCCETMSNLRVRLRKIMFGDQGMFIDKNLFFEIGGFPDIPIMEDYQFSINLRKRKIKIKMCKGKILTSERRFVEGGRLKTMWKMHKLRFLYRKGVDVNEISKMYRDVR